MRYITQKSRLVKYAHKDCLNTLKSLQKLDDIANMTIVVTLIIMVFFMWFVSLRDGLAISPDRMSKRRQPVTTSGT
jgi:hypothetical protein